MLLPYQHIAIEGPIGVGKTSLALRLAKHYQTATLLEDASAVEFLPAFYSDQPNSALPTQLAFLFQRVQKIKQLLEGDQAQQVPARAQTVVADFMLEKEQLFAKTCLDKASLILYKQCYNNAIESLQNTIDRVINKTSLAASTQAEQIAPASSAARTASFPVSPDLVIYLQADTETLLKRVRIRGSIDELRISEEYLNAINNTYAEFFHSYTSAPLLIVNADSVDLAHSEKDFDHLVKRLLQPIKGTNYFNPMSLSA